MSLSFFEFFEFLFCCFEFFEFWVIWGGWRAAPCNLLGGAVLGSVLVYIIPALVFVGTSLKKQA